MSKNSIWLIDRTLIGVSTQGLIGPGSDGKEGVLRNSQCSSIRETSRSDCLTIYLGHLLGVWPSAEIQLENSKLGCIVLGGGLWFTVQMRDLPVRLHIRNVWNTWGPLSSFWISQNSLIHLHHLSICMVWPRTMRYLSRRWLEGSLFNSYYTEMQ